MVKIKDNNIVYVNLTDETVRSEEVPSEMREKYVGGAGINTRLLYDSGAMYEDALSEKNVVIIGIGPTTGTGLMSGNRCTITAKSPVTGIFGDSSTGGNFVLNMKALHIDHIVFQGKAKEPVYLLIKADGSIEIKPADEIWGKNVSETNEYFHSIYSKDCEVLCIGQAGENLIRFANVIVSRWHAAGRMGMGCVLGSKKVKAVVIEKKRPMQINMYNKFNITKINKLWFKVAKKSMLTKNESIDGTLFLTERYNEIGHLPIKNCQTGHDERAKNIYSAPFNLKYVDKKTACYSCPARCGRAYEVKEGKYKGEKGERLDYGAAVSLGPAFGIFEWDKIIHLKLLVDELAMDTIELGGLIALVLECSERNLIDDKFTGGRRYQFGNVEDIEYLLNAIAKREGIGNILAEGTYRAAKIMNIENYAMCIKKSSTGTHSKDRLAWTLGYVTSTRGGDHLKHFPFTMLFGGYFANLVGKYIFKINPKTEISKPEKKGRVVWWHENYKTSIDSMGFCLFAMHALPNLGHGYFDEFAYILNNLYGTDLKDIDVFYASERIYQLQNMFNIISGMDIDDYQIPKRNPDDNIDEKYLEKTNVDVLHHPGMLPEYFKYRGKSNDARPTKRRLKEVGLEDEIEKIPDIEDDCGFSMEDALTEVSLNAKFKYWDKKKAFFLSKIIILVLDRMEKKRVKAYQSELKKRLIERRKC